MCRGCVDQIFAVRQVIEKVMKRTKLCSYAAFVDLEKTYDEVVGGFETLWCKGKTISSSTKLL